jgi:general secretion pathway protein G
MQQKRWREKAFTLLELMVVVTILGILASIATIRVLQYLKRAKSVKARQDMKNIMTAIDLFQADYDRYPEDLQELTEPTDEFPQGRLSGIPKDPWGNDYEYVPDTENGYDLVCYGKDGAPGGEGEDADINSWEMDQPAEEGEESGDYSGDSGG